ncbi:alpha/beta fold hydrolase [Nocardia sp. NPDC057668]|uniref:alpha/beta fold hydrolase n=1 Tax=Nocardia sp. NPDC057668 TaxID=3346202 RepID=UPI00367060FE
MTTATPTLLVPVGDSNFEVHRAGPVSTAQRTTALLLHGFPQSAASWHAVAQHLSAFGITSYAPNQRGYSAGARHHPVEAYRLSELVADVVGLCDALALDTVHLVGHDWGAIVAWATAAHHPDRVTSLTAVSVPHPAAFARAIGTDPEQQEMSAYLGLLEQDGTADLLLTNDAAALRLGYGDALTRETADAHIRLLSEPGAMSAALNWYRARGTSWHEVPPVTVPTTFVWGADDMAVSRSAAYGCAEHVTAPYEFVELAATGHWVPEQEPARLSTAIIHRIVG